MRVYDVYASHSWASGTSPFADANNQESTSEAVTAWMGLRLWAETSGDQALADQAAWMQSSEADAALKYWLNFNVDDPLYAPLEYSYLPLNFGGKQDLVGSSIYYVTRPGNWGPIPFSSSEAKGRNYSEVVKQLEDAGFTNVETVPIRDLVTGILTHDGSVEKITINGDAEFTKNKD